jgi:NAD(P)-dependent dehydrogenase (short-subunit alcohol dehydrogenase family)
MNTTLNGQCVLITGGGSGIGLAAARRFLAEGARVAIAGRDADKLRRAADELGGGDGLIHHAADVTDPKQVQRLVDDTTRHLGRIDILVNNAGLNIKERSFRELTPERWRTLTAGNLDGAFYCMSEVLPQMRKRRGGLIINVNSIAGKRANPLGGPAYIAAKFGLRGLAMGVAAEEKAHNIRISSIYPGEVDTPILEQRPSPLSEEHRRTILQSDDVAAAILFIAALPAHVWVPELVITPTKAQYI